MKLISSSVEIVDQKDDLAGIFNHIELVGKTCYKSEVKGGETALNFVKKLIQNKHYAMLEHGTCYLWFENYESSPEGVNFVSRYKNNKYSRVNIVFKDAYITTNYRVIEENKWLFDLRHLTNRTNHHIKRISAKFICSRAIANEIVRHRIFSFAQESTRYCNYSKDKFGNEIQIIIPEWINSRIAENQLDNISKEDAIEILEDKYYDILSYVTTMDCLSLTYNDLIAHGLSPQFARGILPLDLKTELWMTGFKDDFNHFFELRASNNLGNPHPDVMVLAKKLETLIK